MTVLLAAVAACLLAVLAAAVVFLLKWRGESSRRADVEQQLQRYSAIIDVEAHVAGVRQSIANLIAERDQFTAAEQKRRAELNGTYQGAFATYQRLKQEVTLLEETLEDISFGLYKPHYTFETSEQFKGALASIYEQKRELIRGGVAATCETTWTVGNSERDGKRMVKQQTKLMLRAFNGEVDAAVAKVTWNNVTKMEERIRKCASAINDTGTVMRCSISPQFVELALAELRLTYEYELKKHEEKEEQRRIREQMRDEEKALREAERAQQEAAAEETRFEKALAKARAEVEKAKGEELAKANAKMAELEQRLSEAHAKMQKATSMAQLTKSGHVYVISNVGSFGDKTFKIGMTRRLDPLDRVYELSDASVPFDFDVHAMIYSEDAPGLENAFHKAFADRRVNLVNLRREFFNVSLDEIEEFARKQNLAIEFTKVTEAREYRETISIRRAAMAPAAAPKSGAEAGAAAPMPPPTPEAFPTQILV
ncbi:DUF4041 domain-containing protein [Anaeromyxobacter dehalogenans]|uniref:Chromosome segregation ATPase n=1 Tax=Anaeromyxobacter dehalogenans (strain 2CP-C) TaxID=290397 RepID=Q2IIZ2_ANADE|nr:DUF4041 domain-containing protein [Anaeromyxobacter dehalogenans]ABC81619.1 chromosome segregation ATPase [Anaeromyxobacter dehalogenans 2CP-C]